MILMNVLRLNPARPWTLWGLVGLSTGLLWMGIGWTPPASAAPLSPEWSRSWQLYRQPHAVWLSADHGVGANLGTLNYALAMAARRHQSPEVVVYALPLRDLGQSSEGGFKTMADYRAENQLLAEALRQFTQQTRLQPTVILEPDALAQALQYRADTQDSPESVRVYQERVSVLAELVRLYRQAGARVWLDAAHSGWFDHSEADVQRLADALKAAGIAQADGLVSNVSNRQPFTLGPATEGMPNPKAELPYLQRLLSRLPNRKLPVWIDTSRNGATYNRLTPRQYRLLPDGRLMDNERPAGRWVGHWRAEGGDLLLSPFFGPPKRVSRLTQREKYQFDPGAKTLTAPPWLDPVGDVQPGPAPTDSPPASLKSLCPALAGFRYIKPPDECDGAVGCPPGESKRDTWARMDALSGAR